MGKTLIKKNKTKDFFSNFFNKVFSSNKNAILFLGLSLFIVMAIYFIYILFGKNNFYNNWSDDSLQYYPIMCDFIADLKSGNFSFYSMENYLGASFFSDTYYIPLDFFTLIIYLLSFLMNTEIAMSIVEILKLILGSVVFSVYLSLRGSKPKTSALLGLMYFSCAGITCFSAFCSFTSLAFYLPFSLIIIHYFLKGKWYFVPPYAMLLVFFNFYLAYTVYAFMAFACLFALIIEKRKFHKIILDTLVFILLVVFGLFMSMCVFYPSIEFILKSTSRNVIKEGSFASLVLMFKGYIEILLTAITSFFKFIILSFTQAKGFFGSTEFIQNSFIQVKHLYLTLNRSRTIDGVLVHPAFFNIEQYFRMMATTYTPLTPTSFYGYQGSYFVEHTSFYITGFGLLLSTLVWSLNDHRSKVYKAMIIFILFLCSLPLFSYILSANFEVLYTRWMNVIDIPLLLIGAHILDVKEEKEIKPKFALMGVIILYYFVVYSGYHHLEVISGYGVKNNWDENILSFELSLYVVTVIFLFITILLFVGLHFIRRIQNKDKLKKILYPVILGVFLLSIVILSIILLNSLLKIDKNLFDLPSHLFKTEVKEAILFSIENQMEYQYLAFFIMLLIIVQAYALVNKKKVVLGIMLSIEVLISALLSFGIPLVNRAYSGRETTFNNCHELSEFIKKNSDENDLYRVYVDGSIPDLLSTNISRFIGKGTNSNVFHSFIYDETDKLVDHIFDIKDEGQAGKRALNTYSYYLNILLGYKYVIASPQSSFKDYDENQFELVELTDKYIFLKFKDYQEFLVYDSYVSESRYRTIKNNLKDISREKFMLNYVIIDSNYLKTVREYFGLQADISDYTDSSTEKTFNQKTTLSIDNTEIVMVGDKKYYRYEFIGDDEITTRSYAINIHNLDNRKYELVEDNNMYIEFDYFTSPGERAKQVIDESNIRNINGSSFHIPIYGGGSSENTKKPKYLYIKAKENSTTKELLTYTVEAIMPPIDYIETYESEGTLPNGVSLSSMVKFGIHSKISNDTVNLALTKIGSSSKISINSFIVEYMDGTFASVSQEVSITKPIRNIYVSRTNDMWSSSVTFVLKASLYSIENAYNDDFISKDIERIGSNYIIKYRKNAKEGNSLIVLPMAYSEEFKVRSGDVLDVISVNGGFLGIIIDNTITENSIVLEFVPRGLNEGINLTILGISTYLILLSNYVLFKKWRKEKLCKL